MKIRTMLLVLALLALPFAALAEAPAQVTDMMGDVVAFDSHPQTCVSLSPSNSEILFALGLGDKVIGVDTVTNYPPEAAAVESKVGDYSGPNLEAIVALKPDVVFASTRLQADVLAQLKELGISVVASEAAAYAEIPQSIQLIADVMGADASPLIAEMQKAEAQVAEKAKTLSPVRVYFAVSFGEYGDWTAAKGTFVDDMITLAGGVNVAHDGEAPWMMYSLEQIVADDPDVIILSAYPGMDEEFVKLPGYSELRAVKNGQVYLIDPDISARPAPRISEALSQVQEAVIGGQEAMKDAA